VIRMAVTDDPVPVAFDHGGELLEGLEPLPAQLALPALEELTGPERILVVPELPEGFLEQIRLVEPFVGLQQRTQGPLALEIQVGLMGQQRVALSLDELALFVIDPLVLAASDLIQSIGEMTHDVELVVDDLRPGGILERCVPERFPHVHDGQLEALAALRAHLVEEVLQVLLGAALTPQPDRPPLIEIGHHDDVGVSLAHRDLVDANGPKMLRGRVPLQQAAHVAFFHAPDLVPAEVVEFRHSRHTHLAAELSDAVLEALREPGRLGQPAQGLAFHGLAPWARHPAVLELEVDAGGSGIQVPHSVPAPVSAARYRGSARRADRFF